MNTLTVWLECPCRPENPVDYLARYLIAQNPMKDGPGGKKEEKEEKKE